MKPLKALIVDDEPLAREGLALRLGEIEDIEVVRECPNSRVAKSAIEELNPDVIFLDVEMPGMTGVELGKQIDPENGPAIVFVTAYKNYAIEAFELDVVDYLVKPVNQSRLNETVERLKERRKVKQLGQDKKYLMQLVWDATGKDANEIEHLLEEGEPIGTAYPEKIAIRDPGSITQLIPCADIEWVEAAGDYMCVNASGETYILRSTMKELEKQLNPNLFQRIHRSSIVNVKHVTGVKSHSNGECFITLNSGTELKVSRSYKKKITDFL